jgi:hypothetical protein
MSIASLLRASHSRQVEIGNASVAIAYALIVPSALVSSELSYRLHLSVLLETALIHSRMSLQARPTLDSNHRGGGICSICSGAVLQLGFRHTVVSNRGRRHLR